MLLSFMFHTINLPTSLSSCVWFFKAALPSHNTVPLLSYITFAQYKHYLLLILKKNDKEKGSKDESDDVLKIIKPKVSYSIEIVPFNYQYSVT